MAAVTTLLGTVTFTSPNGTKTVTAAPAVGDLITIQQFHSGNTTSTEPSDDNADGLGAGYTLVETLAVGGGADLMEVWVRDAAIGSATSTTFTTAPGTTSGGGLAVLKTTGMSKYGLTAIRQSATNSTGAAAAPSVPLDFAALTTNPVIGFAINASNPNGQTVTATFTALASTAYNTPTRGMHVQGVDSGFTGSTLTWGGTSATATASIAYELDSSAAAGVVGFIRSYQQAVNRASTY